MKPEIVYVFSLCVAVAFGQKEEATTSHSDTYSDNYENVYFQDSSLNRNNICKRLDNSFGVCVPFGECPDIENVKNSLLCSGNTVCCQKKLPHEHGSVGHQLDEMRGYDFTDECIASNNDYAVSSNPKYKITSEYPPIAAIGYYNSFTIIWVCVGAIISEHFILSSASCGVESDALVGNNDINVVRIGDRQLRASNNYNTDDLMNIEQIIKPEEFHFDKVNYNLQLLKIKQKITFHRYFRPSCLYNQYPFNFKENFLSVTWRVHRENLVEKLVGEQYVYVEQERCKKTHNITTQRNLFCANVVQNCTVTASFQTYNAPVFIVQNQIKTSSNENLPIYFLAGIKSFGERCNQKPFVFIRPSYFRDWIEKHVKAYSGL